VETILKCTLKQEHARDGAQVHLETGAHLEIGAHLDNTLVYLRTRSSALGGAHLDSTRARLGVHLETVDLDYQEMAGDGARELAEDGGSRLAGSMLEMVEMDLPSAS